MARRRMIHPKFWFSRHWTRVKKFRTRLLYIGIFSNADDEGRLIGLTPTLKSIIFPHDEISNKAILEDLESLIAEKMIRRYEVEGVPYIQVIKWHDHQSISHPQKSVLPSYEQAELFNGSNSGDHKADEIRNESGNDSGMVPESEPQIESESGQNDETESGTNGQFRNDSGTVQSSIGKASSDQVHENSADSKSAVSGYAMAISEYSHGEQREKYPKQSIWLSKTIFDATVLRGAKAIDILINKKGWEKNRLEKVLRFILEDDWWRPRLKSLASVWKAGKNDQRKIENAEADMIGVDRRSGGPKQTGNRRTPAKGNKSDYAKKKTGE